MEASRSAGAGVFISYRRGDTGAYALLLKRDLLRCFPEIPIFMDVDSLEPGSPFAEIIQDRIGLSAVLIALIGRRWLIDDGGKPRLQEPGDFVRFEIATALEHNVPVIPVLVDNVRVPDEKQLPEPLAKLSTLHVAELSLSRYEFDTDRLLKAVEHCLSMPQPEVKQRVRQRVLDALSNEQRFLDRLDDSWSYALGEILRAARSMGATFEWDSSGTAIHIPTSNRTEPIVTIAWVFADRGPSGKGYLTMGYEEGGNARSPSVQAALSKYARAVSVIPGSVRIDSSERHAYTFLPQEVSAQHATLIAVLQDSIRTVREGDGTDAMWGNGYDY